MELAEGTARQAYHNASKKYGGTTKGLSVTTSIASTRGAASGSSGGAGLGVGVHHHHHLHDDDSDSEDEEVRLKTRQEIWAENHLRKRGGA